jgi:hypothetical protein
LRYRAPGLLAGAALSAAALFTCLALALIAPRVGAYEHKRLN